MFTQRAGLLGFVAFCFYLIAVVNSLPGFYYLLSWMSLGLLAASLGIAFLSLIGLDCQWRLGQSQGYASWNIAGEDTEDASEVPTLLLSLHNRGTLNKTGLVLEVQFKTLGDAASSSNERRSFWNRIRRRRRQDNTLAHRYLLEALPSGCQLEAVLPLYQLPRGRHEVLGISLIGSDVLGLFRIRRRLVNRSEGALELLIGPSVTVEVSAAHSMGRGHVATGNHRVQRFGVGHEVRGTREYVPGDDLRHVHWKSTARVGELVVREWEHTGHSAVLVVWDGAQGTSWGRAPFDTTEIGLSLTGSLCATLLRAGTPCALSCLGSEPIYLAPFERAPQGITLPEPQFKALASAVAQRRDSALSALESISRGESRDYDVVFWVTASLSPALSESFRHYRGRTQIWVVLIDGAAVREWSPDSYTTKTAIEPFGGMPNGIPVNAASYDAQEKALRQVGAEVVRVAPHSHSELAAVLRSAVQTLVELS